MFMYPLDLSYTYFFTPFIYINYVTHPIADHSLGLLKFNYGFFTFTNIESTMLILTNTEISMKIIAIIVSEHYFHLA
jgi:hypothetical protein